MQTSLTPCQSLDYAAFELDGVRPSDEGVPKLLVVIDTEEEFDWNSQPDSQERAVTAIDHIDRVQSIFDDYGVVPCYVIDHPVASEPKASSRLRKIMEDGRCEIGAHLHPWVNPPLADKLNGRADMYPGNLPKQQERAKLESLTECITQSFGERPTTYKAGRYGFGPNTLETLFELGYEIDLSFCPPLDSRADGGPTFHQCSAKPFWFRGKKMLEIPVTGGFTGVFGQFSPVIYRWASTLKQLKAQAILSRLGLLDRLTLSPEGFTTEEHIKLTRFLYAAGVRTFTWSFHSTSVKPGCAPYVTTDQDLNLFLESFNRYFDFFLGEFGGVNTTPTKVKKHMESTA